MLNTIDKLHISYNGIFDNNKPMTQSEQMYYLLSKLNLIIEHFNLLETNTNKSITDFNEKNNIAFQGHTKAWLGSICDI